jgi:hypothetical protein
MIDDFELSFKLNAINCQLAKQTGRYFILDSQLRNDGNAKSLGDSHFDRIRIIARPNNLPC